MAEPEPEPISFSSALAISLRLAAYSSLAFAGPIYVELCREVALYTFYDDPADVDFSNLETVYLWNSTHDVTFRVLSKLPNEYLFHFLFLPILVWAYLGKSFPKLSLIITLFSSLFVVIYLFGQKGMGLVNTFSASISVGIFAMLLKFQLPSDSKIPWQVIRFFVINIIASLFASFIILTPVNFSNNLLALCLWMPLVREWMRMISSRSSWLLGFRETIAGTGITPNRNHAWSFTGYIQLCWAIHFRINMANVDNAFWNTILVTFQAVVEIALRITMAYRDAAFERISKCWSKRKRTTTIVAAKDDHEIKEMTTRETIIMGKQKAKRAEAKRTFCAQVLIVEMMSEYVGIMFIPFMLYYSKDKILMDPYSWYTGIDNPFQETIDFSPVIVSSIIQFCVEIFVDSFCIMYEVRKNKYPLDSVFYSQTNYAFLGLFVFCSTYAYIANKILNASWLFNASSCVNVDICYCTGAGLPKDGVFDKYCKLKYPNSSGVPS